MLFHSLFSAFVIHFLKSIIRTLVACRKVGVKLVTELGHVDFSRTWSQILKTGFKVMRSILSKWSIIDQLTIVYHVIVYI